MPVSNSLMALVPPSPIDETVNLRAVLRLLDAADADLAGGHDGAPARARARLADARGLLAQVLGLPTNRLLGGQG